MKKTQTQNTPHTLIKLGIFAIITISGLLMMLRTAQQINAQVPFVDLERAQSPIYQDFNPCAEVKCAPGVVATFVGEKPLTAKLAPYGGSKICECPDGKQIITRPYTPRIYA